MTKEFVVLRYEYKEIKGSFGLLRCLVVRHRKRREWNPFICDQLSQPRQSKQRFQTVFCYKPLCILVSMFVETVGRTSTLRQALTKLIMNYFFGFFVYLLIMNFSYICAF